MARHFRLVVRNTDGISLVVPSWPLSQWRTFATLLSSRRRYRLSLRTLPVLGRCGVSRSRICRTWLILSWTNTRVRFRRVVSIRLYLRKFFTSGYSVNSAAKKQPQTQTLDSASFKSSLSASRSFFLAL